MPKKPTKAQTVKALDSCIRRWARIAKGQTYSDGTRTCALCHLYYPARHSGDDSFCKGCPVKAVTGEPGCNGTPWDIFAWVASEREHGFLWADSEDAKKAATAMHNFLKTVRTGFGPKATTRKD